MKLRLLTQIIVEISKEFQNVIIQKDQQIQSLREHINYLSKKTNEQERYSSKNCLIISNLPLVTGISYSVDVILFPKDYMGVIVNEWDLHACHRLSKLSSELSPPAVIVRFLHFNVKDKIWGRKYMLKGKTNPKKNNSRYFHKKHLRKQIRIIWTMLEAWVARQPRTTRCLKSW